MVGEPIYQLMNERILAVTTLRMGITGYLRAVLRVHGRFLIIFFWKFRVHNLLLLVKNDEHSALTFTFVPLTSVITLVEDVHKTRKQAKGYQPETCFSVDKRKRIE